MTDKQMIEIIQARMDGKDVESRPYGKKECWKLMKDSDTWEFGAREYRIRPETNTTGFPRTWEEYCQEGFHTKDAIDVQMPFIGQIQTYDSKVPATYYSKAFVALAKLVLLRDRYNEGWQPDWKNGDYKYCIIASKGNIYLSTRTCEQFVLCFKNGELRDAFMERFSDLINEAKPLL